MHELQTPTLRVAASGELELRTRGADGPEGVAQVELVARLRQDCRMRKAKKRKHRVYEQHPIDESLSTPYDAPAFADVSDAKDKGQRSRSRVR